MFHILSLIIYFIVKNDVSKCVEMQMCDYKKSLSLVEIKSHAENSNFRSA